MRKFLLAIAVFLCALSAYAVSVTPILQPHVSLVDASGNPCAGCKLYSYAAGTTTPLATYTDSTGIPQNTNPIVLDASGSAQIWMGTNAYKFILKTAAGAILWTVDNVNSGGGGGGTIGTVANIAGLRNYPGSGMVNVIGFYSASLTSAPDGGGGNFVDIGSGVSGDDDGGVTIYDASTGHKWRRQFVNSDISVQWFGARGDCTVAGSTVSCSDNLTSIQDAINYAASSKSCVYYPANQPGIPTVYWTSGTLNPKGVCMKMPQHGDVVNVGVAVRGSPSKDVFAPGDPTSMGYVTPSPTFQWDQMTLIVDDTVDASSTFPNRLPGKTVFDGVAAASSAVVTSSSMSFQPGDVGNAFRCYGCGAAGANLDTTIASVQSLSQATMAATASTSVASNGHFYLAIKGLSVTQTVGNCGLAYDDYASTGYITHGVNHSTFTNVDIITPDNTSRNSTCGMFFQGAGGVYDTRWESNYIAGLDYGMIFGMNNSGTPSSTAMADHNKFLNGTIGTTYEWVSYGGAAGRIEGLKLFGRQGPHILNAPTSAGVSYPVGWSIDITESEGASAGDISYRISGLDHLVRRLESPRHTTLQWDAHNSKVESYISNEDVVNVAGNKNEFLIAAYPTGVPGTLNFTGVGNKWATLGCAQGANTCYGKKELLGGDASKFASTYGHPEASRSATGFDRTADYIDNGPEAYYNNNDDLRLWPQDVRATGGYTVTTQGDTTAQSGNEILVGNTGFTITDSGTAGLYWGKQFPAKKVRFIVRAKATASITGWTAQILSGGTGICTITMNLTTSWQIGRCDGDASAYDSTQVNITIAASGDAAKTAYIDYMKVRPWTSTLLGLDMQTGTSEVGTSLQLAGGTAMTANHGTGTNVQHSDGTGTVDHPAIYAADGSVTDGPAGVTGGSCSHWTNGICDTP